MKTNLGFLATEKPTRWKLWIENAWIPGIASSPVLRTRRAITTAVWGTARGENTKVVNSIAPACCTIATTPVPPEVPSVYAAYPLAS